jgi:hypothetical protein
LTGGVNAADTTLEYIGFGGSSTAVDAAREKVHGTLLDWAKKIDKLPIYLGFGGSNIEVDKVQDEAHGALREGLDELASTVTKARDERGFLASVVRSTAEIGPYVIGGGGTLKVFKPKGKPGGGGPDRTPDGNGESLPDGSNTGETPNGENASGTRGQGTRVEPKKGTVVTEEGAKPNANEERAGDGLANEGYDVTFQKTANDSGIQDVPTADMRVEGVGQVDVYTPSPVTKDDSIVRTIVKKHRQGNGVLIQTDLPYDKIVTFKNRVFGNPGAEKITTLFFQDSKNNIIRFDKGN